MANQNFKVKKGLEVGTGVTISDGNINISGIITAQFSGDGSALTGVTAAGSGVVVQEEGSNVGTAATINFIGSNVTAALSGGIANVTVAGGGDVVTDTTPQLGGNLDLNSKDITGTGNISITGGFNATGVSTFQENVNFTSTASFGDNDKINVGTGNDLQIFHDGTSNIISDAVGAGISLVGNTKVVGVLTATSFSGSLATTNLTGTITNAQLANDSVSFGGISVDLGSSDATPAFDLSDATNYPTSSLSGTITNAQLAGSIADGKLASTFLKNVVEDTTPQLGGNLDVNGKDTTGTGNINLTGIVTATSFSGSGSGLTDLTGASAGTYGASTNTPIITVDSNGRITGISTVATSGAGGGGGISNIVEDTTPQLGGNLDLNSKSITGTGNIEITGYAGVSGVSTFSGAVGFATHIHDAGTGGLDIRTNLLRIKNDADSETLATFAEDGAVSFYHDNALRLATTNTGVSITDNLNVAGVSTFTGNVILNANLDLQDDDKILVGAGDDIQIYHSSGQSYIQNSTGNFRIDADALRLRSKTGSEDYIKADVNGAVELYHDNSKKFETTASGATVTGTLAATAVTGDGSGLTGLPAAGISTASTNVQVNFDVTANGSGAYRFTGPGNDAADDNPDLYLIRGQRYRFTNNSGGSHPFQIRSAAGGSAYSTGVTNNGGASGNIDFNVQHDAPSRLYYQCTSHSAMVGNIYITGGANWQTTSVNTSTAEEIFTLNNVGIGTDNPVGNLEVRDSKANLIVAKDGLTVKSNSDLHTSYDMLQIGAGGALASYSTATATADTQFIHNAYRHSGGTFKYRYADSAARIRMNSPAGAIIFDNAASGSADGDITFSERLSITTDRVRIYGDSNYFTDIIGNSQTVTSGVRDAGCRFIGPEARRMYFEIKGNDSTDHIRFITSPNNDQALDYAAMHIGNNGNVGIGEIEPANRLVVQKVNASGDVGVRIKNDTLTDGNATNPTTASLYLNTSTTDFNTFYIQARRHDGATHFGRSDPRGANHTPHLVITSDGKVGIGEDSPDGLLVIKGDSNGSSNPSIRLKDGSDTREAWITNASGDLILANGGNDNTPHCKITMFDGNIFSVETANTQRLRIDASGRLFLYSITGNASSGSTLKYSAGDDEVRYDTSSRLLKTNITECTYGIETIKKLKPSRYTPQEYDTDGNINVTDEILIGFIADEMVEEVPEVVQMYPKSTLTKNVEDTEIVPAAISYDKLTAVLTKALQEAIAKIETLEAKVAALEG